MSDSTRWNRAAEFLNWPPLDQWPPIDLEDLAAEAREALLVKARAVQMYVEGEAQAVIYTVTGLPRHVVLRAAKKCTAQHADGRIFGFRGLLAAAGRKAYERRAEVKAAPVGGHGGYSGALGQLFRQIPNAEGDLRELALRKMRIGGVSLNRLTPLVFHGIVLEFLRKNGIRNDQWPFNTKHQGRTTFNKLRIEFLNSKPEIAAKEHYGSQAKARTYTGRGDRLLEFEEPFDAVQLDGYSINALFSVLFEDPNGFERSILIGRIWLLAVTLTVTGAVLGFAVVYKEAVTAEDVKKLLRKVCFEQWSPRELSIPGLNYSREGGFPNGVLPECSRAGFGALYVDGALAHLSRAVYDQFRRATGCIVNIGPPGQPARRPSIENLFGQISKDVFLQHPASTGTNPQKHRAEKAEKIAVQFQVRPEHAEEKLEVYLAKHNGIPTQGLYNLSPLGGIRAFIDQRKSHFLIRQNSADMASGNTALHERAKCRVRGGPQTGDAPFIRYAGARYSNDLLRRSAELVGIELTCVIENPEEARALRAYLPNGSEFGYLEVQGKWKRSRHSFETRRKINSLIAQRLLIVLEDEDPVVVYVRYLGAQGTTKNPISRTNATKAARVAQEAGFVPTLSSAGKVTPKDVGLRLSEVAGHSSLVERPLPDFTKILGRR